MSEPIIKKKKVINADGHHGGAWKVAYADFVTAMMAFFLLMWLLNATTEDQRKGIADYFNPTIPLSRISGGGAQALSGDSIRTQDTLARSGTGTKGEDFSPLQSKNAETDNTIEAASSANSDIEKEHNESVAQEQLAIMQKAIRESEGTLSEHLRVKMSPEGIVLELVESESVSLFSIGNASPSPLLKELISIVSMSFSDLDNNIKIVGHTDALTYPDNADYSNWDLSTDRANTARKLLVSNGFPAEQISEVAGKADTDPLSENKFAPENRRISLTILRNQ